jgi:hypothetical protein
VEGRHSCQRREAVAGSDIGVLRLPIGKATKRKTSAATKKDAGRQNIKKYTNIRKKKAAASTEEMAANI